MLIFRIILFPSILILILVLEINGQNLNKQADTPENTKPELNGHKFITNTMVEGPFLNTDFKLSAGIGSSSNYDLPLVINGKEVKGLFGQITFAAFSARYQQNVKSWLAFSVSADMKGRLGTQTVSVLTEGIDLGTSMGFGWIFKLHKSRKFMLGASAGLSNQTVTIFNLYDFIDKIIQSGEITQGNRLVKTINITAGVAGIKAAYAFNPTFGCIGKINFGYGESVSSDNKVYFDAGISMDADLNPKLKVPLGFAFGYNWNNYTQTDVNITNPQNILFKVNYTGKKDFDLGVEMNAQFLKLTRLSKDINLKVLFIKAGIAYYF